MLLLLRCLRQKKVRIPFVAPGRRNGYSKGWFATGQGVRRKGARLLFLLHVAN